MYISSRAFINYWRTIRLVVTISGPLMSGWNGKIASHSSVSECSQIHSLKRVGYVSRSRDFSRFTCPSDTLCSVTSEDEIRSRSSTVSNRYKLMHTPVSSNRFCGAFLAKRYILQQKCLKEQIETCLLGTRWCNF